MLRYSKLSTLCVAQCVLLGSRYESEAEALTSKEENQKAYEITQRLRNGMDQNNLRIRPSVKNDAPVRVFTLWKDGGYIFGKNGLPIARVATCDIKGDINTVADKYVDIKHRKDWDRTADDTYSSVSKDDGVSYSYFKGKAGWLVPARDFVFTQVELPPGVVNISDIQARVIFNRDCHDKLPLGRAIRGEQNSLLILQSGGLHKTKVTMLTECDPKGWANIFGTGTMDWLVGDSTVQVIKYLKESVEMEVEQDAGLSVEEAARLRFMKKQRQMDELGSNTIVEELSPAAREDLIETVKMLEVRLSKIVKDEHETKMDLTELKARVNSDLSKAKMRLRG